MHFGLLDDLYITLGKLENIYWLYIDNWILFNKYDVFHTNAKKRYDFYTIITPFISTLYLHIHTLFALVCAYMHCLISLIFILCFPLVHTTICYYIGIPYFYVYRSFSFLSFFCAVLVINPCLGMLFIDFRCLFVRIWPMFCSRSH